MHDSCQSSYFYVFRNTENIYLNESKYANLYKVQAKECFVYVSHSDFLNVFFIWILSWIIDLFKMSLTQIKKFIKQSEIAFC